MRDGHVSGWKGWHGILGHEHSGVNVRLGAVSSFLLVGECIVSWHGKGIQTAQVWDRCGFRFRTRRAV